jgi:hypothetical protein
MKLDDAFGPDAAEDLVTLFDDIRAEQRAMRGDMAELKQEMRAMELRLSEKLTEKLSDKIHGSFAELSRAVAAIAMLAGVFQK